MATQPEFLVAKEKNNVSRIGDRISRNFEPWCSRFYARISSLPIKPELHGKTRELSTWINVFLVNQISVDIIILKNTFHIYNLFITYSFTALY